MLCKYFSRVLAVLATGVFMAPLAQAGCNAVTNIKEQFNSGATVNSWLSFNGACLTAGTGTNQSALPGCLKSTYYNSQVQVGGANGFLGTGSGGTAPSSAAGQVPDASGSGALRLTNGYLSSLSGATSTFPYGFNQNGAILSNFCFPSADGLQITFTTVTYEGNSGGNGGTGTVSANDGADGISFFLVDDAVATAAYNTPLDSGAFGGSLGYTCSNSNNDSTKRSDGSTRGYDGLVGAFLGLGIDEFGNFLNPSDNTVSGPGLQADRIGLRGAGSISWKALHALNSTLYPSSWSVAQQQAAVQNTCKAGYLMDNFQPKNSNGQITQYGHYYTSTSGATSNSKTNSNGALVAIPAPDYPMITDSNGNGAFKVLSGVKIAAEGARTRGDSANNPITYNVKITQEGLLTFQYSYNGGPWQPVITGSSIMQNGTIPTNFRFGFAGSTGGSTNVHEILCFNAQPGTSSNSSGGVNVYQNPTIKSGTQVFLAFYFPGSETGSLTAQQIGFNGTAIVANTAPVWDASCVLTGVGGGPQQMSKCLATGATSVAVEAPASRTMLTWSNGAPTQFQYGKLSTTDQSTIDPGNTANPDPRVDFLRGGRGNETTSTKAGLFRQRSNVLGDIVNSSPTWVGPPQTYTNMDTWVDQTQATVSQPENSGQTYSAFQTAEQGRLNVVYVGANDGFLHGFRAGSLDSSGNLQTSNAKGPTPNDGNEVLAYMPGAVLQSIHNAGQPELDYSNTLYAHAWFVDATPGTGDLFYTSASCADPTQGCWHTWLVGGLGAGGAAIYMLDVTDPAQFSESNPAATVIGEWTSANLTCTNTKSGSPSCGTYLGNTYGTPLIRRFHNGQWGVIFGNGYGSTNGNAGIFIMLIDPKTAAKSFYYLDTGSTAAKNGIGPTTSADLDLDHTIDFIYAGDLLGNVWRFDVTNPDPTQWAVSASSPLFTTPTGQPITTAVTVSTLKTINTTFSLTGQVLSTVPERVIINFGTGQQIAQTLTTATQYATTQQAIYGIWDWDMGVPSTSTTPGTGWNAISPGQEGIYILSGPKPVAFNSLQPQTFNTRSADGLTIRQVNKVPVCWPASPLATTPNPSGCSSSNQYGWYMNLPVTNGLAEQAIFDPTISPDGTFVINTFVPPQTSPLVCDPTGSTGFTMALQPDDGNGTPPGYFHLPDGTPADGIQLNGVGIPSFVSSGQAADNNAEYLITQTPNGVANPTPLNRMAIINGQRLNWAQRR
jgi:type IV pilus assembly protein PilY1